MPATARASDRSRSGIHLVCRGLHCLRLQLIKYPSEVIYIFKSTPSLIWFWSLDVEYIFTFVLLALDQIVDCACSNGRREHSHLHAEISTRRRIGDRSKCTGSTYAAAMIRLCLWPFSFCPLERNGMEWDILVNRVAPEARSERDHVM